MDAGAIQTIIANLGFPIACVVAMFWMLNKEREDRKEEREKEREYHNAEMQKVTEALNNNTLALTELRDMISK